MHIRTSTLFSDMVPHRRAKWCWRGRGSRLQPGRPGALGYCYAAYRRVRRDGALGVGLRNEGYVGSELRLFVAFVSMFRRVFDTGS